MEDTKFYVDSDKWTECIQKSQVVETKAFFGGELDDVAVVKAWYHFRTTNQECIQKYGVSELPIPKNYMSDEVNEATKAPLVNILEDLFLLFVRKDNKHPKTIVFLRILFECGNVVCISSSKCNAFVGGRKLIIARIHFQDYHVKDVFEEAKEELGCDDTLCIADYSIGELLHEL